MFNRGGACCYSVPMVLSTDARASLWLVMVTTCRVTFGAGSLHTPHINIVLGDESLGALRDEASGLGEDERIRLHLTYVHALLLARSTEHLSVPLRDARQRNLDRLLDYLNQGDFPRNDEHPDARRPTFVDSLGHICAVGYLIERDLGRH